MVLLLRLAPCAAEIARPRAEHLAQKQKYRNGGRDQRDELEEHGGRRNIVGRAKRSVPAAARDGGHVAIAPLPPYGARLMLASLQQTGSPPMITAVVRFKLPADVTLAAAT